VSTYADTWLRNHVIPRARTYSRGPAVLSLRAGHRVMSCTRSTTSRAAVSTAIRLGSAPPPGGSAPAWPGGWARTRFHCRPAASGSPPHATRSSPSKPPAGPARLTPGPASRITQRRPPAPGVLSRPPAPGPQPRSSRAPPAPGPRADDGQVELTGGLTATRVSVRLVSPGNAFEFAPVTYCHPELSFGRSWAGIAR
jgi:hypothetical protein